MKKAKYYDVVHLSLATGIKYTRKMKDNAQAKVVKAIVSAMKFNISL